MLSPELRELIRELHEEIMRLKLRVSNLEMSYEDWIAQQNEQEKIVDEMFHYFEKPKEEIV